ncbi:MAG: methionine--tRNA ligase subunit beta [bacterium]|nr:methionine--tRNA ligase subunit beta [bacterium]
MTIPIKPTISFEDFAKVDLRVGTIISADDLEDSNKLLKLVVDIGTEKRQIIAGVKKFYKVEDLVGRQIVIVANLEPKSLAGYESQGMLLAASNDEDGPVVLLPEKSVADGASIK